MSVFTEGFWQQAAILAEVCGAVAIGGAVGLERESANRPAGLRTHSLVCATATLLVGLSDLLVDRFASTTLPDVVRADPIRIVEAVVTGVSFLGAGTIFVDRSARSVEGLTTAASLLAVAALGVAIGLGQYVLALAVTLLVLVLLRVVNRWT